MIREDKRLTAEIEPFVEYGETALLTVKITDEINAESLKVVLDDEEISLTSELTYEFNAEKLFAHNFVITAQTNDGEAIEKEVSVYVKDSVCPTMTITYDKPDGYYEGDDIVATIVAEDNVGIKRIEYTYDGVEYPIDENGQVTIPKIHVDTRCRCYSLGHIRQQHYSHKRVYSCIRRRFGKGSCQDRGRR